MHDVRPPNRAQLMITFAHIAACGSISAAAAHLRMDKAAVSRQLQALEGLLDARLMHRSTRRLVLTEVGALIHARARRILHEMEHAQVEAQAFRDKPGGILVVRTSVAFGLMQVTPLLADFRKAFPEVGLHLCLLDEPAATADPVQEGADVLLRMCDAPPPELVAHHLSRIDHVLVASPAFLAGIAPVMAPEDLQACSCLFDAFKRGSALWRFQDGLAERVVPVQAAVSVNSVEAVRALALQGLGIALLPDFSVAADLRAGRLLKVLDGWAVRGESGADLYALHLPGRLATPKVRAFVDFVRDRWAADHPLRWG